MPLKITPGLKDIQRRSTTRTQSSMGMIFPARVVRTITNNKDYPELFNEKGDWASIGGVYFENLGNVERSVSTELFPSLFATSLNPNIKNIPLENEIIYVISLPNNNAQEDDDSFSFYYFNPINIWNSNHQNAIPNLFNRDNTPTTEQKDYGLAENGVPRQTSDALSNISFGKTFREKPNIKSLQPFEGDIIFEGRFGQSFRFGSTNYNSSVFNPWSSTSFSENNGNPITILRNNQHREGNESWVPQVEDINRDGSSIYLTSNQKIPINIKSKNYSSYFGLSPAPPDNYLGSQIILNSSRLLFHSTSDSILLSSNDTINLNSQRSVNIDTYENFSVHIQNQKQGKIFLGSNISKNIEPVILGNRFLDDVKALAEILYSLGNNFELNPMLVETSKSNAELLTIGGDLKDKAKKILDNIERYKSKTTFSK